MELHDTQKGRLWNADTPLTPQKGVSDSPFRELLPLKRCNFGTPDYGFQTPILGVFVTPRKGVTFDMTRDTP